MKISIRLHSSKWFFGRLQNFDLSNSSQWQALSATIIHTAKHLLKFCWCFCATIAQKSPQKSVNTTQIQRECPWIWSCVCLRFYPYPEPKRAGVSFVGLPKSGRLHPASPHRQDPCPAPRRGQRRGRLSAYAAHQCSSWRWNLISSLSMQTVKKLL